MFFMYQEWTRVCADDRDNIVTIFSCPNDFFKVSCPGTTTKHKQYLEPIELSITHFGVLDVMM